MGARVGQEIPVRNYQRDLTREYMKNNSLVTATTVLTINEPLGTDMILSKGNLYPKLKFIYN